MYNLCQSRFLSSNKSVNKRQRLFDQRNTKVTYVIDKRVVDEHETVVKDRKQREVTGEEREELKVALREVLKDMQLQGVGLHLDDIASHGFSRQLINDVAANCQFLVLMTLWVYIQFTPYVMPFAS